MQRIDPKEREQWIAALDRPFGGKRRPSPTEVEANMDSFREFAAALGAKPPDASATE